MKYSLKYLYLPILCGLTLILQGQLAVANEAHKLDDDRKIYLGGSVGQVSLDTFEDIGFDDTLAYRVVGGVQFSPYFGFEVAYVDFDDTDGDDSISKLSVDGTNAVARGIYPLNDKFSVFGKLGFFVWEGEIKAQGGVPARSDGTDLNYGIGLQYYLGGQFDLTLEYNVFELDDADADSILFGFLFYP